MKKTSLSLLCALTCSLSLLHADGFVEICYFSENESNEQLEAPATLAQEESVVALDPAASDPLSEAFSIESELLAVKEELFSEPVSVDFEEYLPEEPSIGAEIAEKGIFPDDPSSRAGYSQGVLGTDPDDAIPPPENGDGKGSNDGSNSQKGIFPDTQSPNSSQPRGQKGVFPDESSTSKPSSQKGIFPDDTSNSRILVPQAKSKN